MELISLVTVINHAEEMKEGKKWRVGGFTCFTIGGKQSTDFD